MNNPFEYHLFEVFGIELEYMIVDRDTLKVKPVSDQLLYDFSGNYSGDFENGNIDWSNELIGHVIELKVHQPAHSLSSLSEDFLKNIKQINQYLEKHNAMILPGSMHPTFNPSAETILWQHDNSDVYNIYNKVFDCREHGWSNLQSTHINLPFSNDEEFARLHAAIRIVLPLIPGIAASSPIIEGALSGYKDGRMLHYLNNQKKIPSLMGKLIPEPVYSQQDYIRTIFQPIIHDFAPFDPHGIMNHYFLNSRGAIARFDRGAIEIRVMDIQECPKADLCIIAMIVALLKSICASDKHKLERIKHADTDMLFTLFKKAIQYGEDCLIENKEYLALFDFKKSPIRIKDFWIRLLNTTIHLGKKNHKDALHLLNIGTLSSRIIAQLNRGKSIDTIYKSLAFCTQENEWLEE